MIDAFNDVQRARADQERARNEAEAYSNESCPRARGEAEHIRQEAEAYKTQVVNLADTRGVAWSGLCHCRRFSTAATRRCLGSVSVPAMRVVLSHPLPILALVGRYPTN